MSLNRVPRGKKIQKIFEKKGDNFRLTGTYIKTRMEVMEMLVKNPAEADFAELYECCFPGVASFVSKMGGRLEDAKDVFHDALVIYFEKFSDPEFEINVSPEAYVLGIAKHLWLRKFRNHKTHVSLDEMEAAINLSEDYFPSISTRRLLRFLEITGRRCLELLTAFYYEKLSAKELLHRFGYSTEHSATVQKYKCIDKAREAMKQKAMTYEDFVE